MGSFVRVCEKPPLLDDENDSSEDSLSDFDFNLADEKMRKKCKWVQSMDGKCGKVGIVVCGVKALAITRVRFDDGDEYAYRDEWLEPVADKAVGEFLRRRLQSCYDKVANRTADVVFSGQSTFHFAQPQFVLVIRPFDVKSAREMLPGWTPLMDATVGEIGMVTGGILDRGVTTVLFEDGVFYNYKDEWLRSVTPVVGESRFLQQSTMPVDSKVNSIVWQQMRERYFAKKIDQDNCLKSLAH